MSQSTPKSLSIIIVEKQGTLKSLKVKDYKPEELYKKCGFKKNDNFLLRAEWSQDEYLIRMYGKTEGKANAENKYEFPPLEYDDEQEEIIVGTNNIPLLFGSCALVCLKQINNDYVYSDLSIELWETIYEKLFGGFEDLGNDDSDEEDELDDVDDIEKTAVGGYLKDGFVVDDDENYDDDDEIGSDDELVEEEYIE